MTWNFIDPNGVTHEIEKETSALADEYAQNWWRDEVMRWESPRHGQQFTDIGWLVEVDADGEELRRIEHGLYYQHSKTDKEEHGTW
jgi:hypothetical protein